MKLFIGRQPILDSAKNTIAYELLYRSGKTTNFCPEIDGSEATSRVLYNLYFGMGIREITRGKKAFVNFNRDLLLADVPKNLKPKDIVIEILEGQKIDQALLYSCKTLKHSGFKLALDDFILNRKTEALLPLASIVKIDWRQTPLSEIKKLCKTLESYGVDLLAEKVETLDDFQRAKELGFRFFQGYFFAKPVILESKEIPVSHWSWLKIFSALQRPDLDFNEVTEIILKDPALSYKLLRIVNSAYFGLSQKVSSIQQTIVLLGEQEVRKWLSLLLLTRISDDKPRELMVTACIRGRLGEMVAQHTNHSELAPSVFLMGILSLLDAIMGRPLKELLAELPLNKNITLALLEKKGPLAPFYFLVRGYEYANKRIITKCAKVLKLDEETLAKCYLNAIQWADTLYTVAQ